MSIEKLSSELHKMIISANPIEATASDKSALEATLDSNKFDDLRVPTHKIRAEGVSGVSGNAYDLKTMMGECGNICGFGNGINLTIPKVDKPQKLAKSIPRDPDTVSLTCQCDDIFPNAGTEAQAQSPDEVNFEELASYFENMLNIPKNLPPSAEIMYT